jgi:hypothetical protein
MDTLNMASQSLSDMCRVDGCHSSVFSTELCGKHKKQEQRQRSAFIKVRPDETWRPSYFKPDLKVKRGRNPKPQVISLDRYKADMGAAGWAADIHGNLTRLPDKPKPTYKPKDGESSNSAADSTAIGKWDAKWRKNASTEFKSVHWAERDRAMFLGQGKLPRTAHVPTVPLTRNPAGWGESSPPARWVGAFTNVETVDGPMGSYERMSGYRIAPRGVSKPCQCSACRQSRNQRVPQA